MKKKYWGFLAGMTTMALLTGLITSSLAGSETEIKVGTLDGQVAYGQAGVALFSQQEVAAGEAASAPNGQKIPTVLTYKDKKGGVGYYVEAGTLASIFDVYGGASWNEKLGCVDFSPRAKGNIILLEPGEEAPKNAPAGSITITMGDGEEMDRIEQERIAAMPTTPKYGEIAAPFTEIDPKTVDMSLGGSYSLLRAKFESSTGVKQHFAYAPGNGSYVVLTILNEGKEDAVCNVSRPYTIGGRDGFSGVRIPAGKTLVRVFEMEKDTRDLEARLELNVTGQGEDHMTKVTMSAEQFRSPETINAANKP